MCWKRLYPQPVLPLLPMYQTILTMLHHDHYLGILHVSGCNKQIKDWLLYFKFIVDFNLELELAVVQCDSIKTEEKFLVMFHKVLIMV